jgi:hypothetical protein
MSSSVEMSFESVGAGSRRSVFYRKCRPSVVTENPNGVYSEINKILSKKWDALSEDEKAKHVDDGSRKRELRARELRAREKWWKAEKEKKNGTQFNVCMDTDKYGNEDTNPIVDPVANSHKNNNYRRNLYGYPKYKYGDEDEDEEDESLRDAVDVKYSEIITIQTNKKAFNNILNNLKHPEYNISHFVCRDGIGTGYFPYIGESFRLKSEKSPNDVGFFVAYPTRSDKLNCDLMSGLVAFEIIKQIAHLQLLCSGVIKSGVGRILINLFIEYAKGRKLDAIHLHSTPLALEFYIDLGFVKVDDDDAMMMTLKDDNKNKP